MGQFIRVCRQELLKTIYSWKIYVSFLLYIIFAYLATRTIGGGSRLVNGYASISDIASYNNFNKILVIIAAFPYATSYYEDIQYGYINYIVKRSGKEIYVSAKIVMCALSSFIVSFISLSVYCTISSMVSGFGVNTRAIIETSKFYDISAGKTPFMVVYFMCFLFSLCSSLYAVMGMMVSAILPNIFVALTGTLFMNVLMEQINAKMPRFLNIFYIQGGNAAYGVKAPFIAICSIAVVLGYMILSGLIFSRYARRRISYESH